MTARNLTEAWALNAACAGAKDDFFNLQDWNKTKLRKICTTCKVQDECIEFALNPLQEYGLWAGTTPDERRERLGLPVRAKG